MTMIKHYLLPNTREVTIEPVSPKAAQLDFLVIDVKLITSQVAPGGTCLRTLYYIMNRGKERRRKPSTRRDLNPRPTNHEAFALPLSKDRNKLPNTVKTEVSSNEDIS